MIGEENMKTTKKEKDEKEKRMWLWFFEGMYCHII